MKGEQARQERARREPKEAQARARAARPAARVVSFSPVVAVDVEMATHGKVGYTEAWPRSGTEGGGERRKEDEERGKVGGGGIGAEDEARSHVSMLLAGERPRALEGGEREGGD